MRNKKWSRKWWEAHVQRWQASGLPAQEYAQQYGLQEYALCRWKTKFGNVFEPSEKRSSKNKDISFIELDLNKEMQPMAELTSPKGWSIKIDPGFSENALKKIIHILDGHA